MMEGIYSSNRIPKFKGINSNMSPSPMNAKMDGQFVISRGGSHQSRSPRYDPYTSDNLDTVDSTMIRFLRSASSSPGTVHSAVDGFSSPVIEAGRSRTMLENKYSNSNSMSKSISYGSRGSSSLSPLSAVENLDMLSPSMLRTPPGFSMLSKDNEDVLVMDGISVGLAPRGRMRLAMESGGSSSSSSSSSGHNSYKSELCRSWEDSGNCRYGFKCQFAHGKEELRPTRFPIKNKSEVQICKSYATTGACTYGTKCRFFHPVKTVAESAKPHTVSPIKVEQASRVISITGRNWSPQDDGIEVILPSSTKKLPAREDVDTYIQAVLYGPTSRRRLQVFAEISPDHSHL